jgi:hypothetical protein
VADQNPGADADLVGEPSQLERFSPSRRDGRLVFGWHQCVAGEFVGFLLLKGGRRLGAPVDVIDEQRVGIVKEQMGGLVEEGEPQVVICQKPCRQSDSSLARSPALCGSTDGAPMWGTHHADRDAHGGALRLKSGQELGGVTNF